ncbi:hypothetical protein B5M47_01855 [candidate division CPR3 bacterium 4484_211]|uniref:Probable peptidoglycan glycosyltransferase FtsW n=1 Tax=candidate division CPR3 bacterium 4484_211 TaxID=1968527 RepID=A0A1W9NYI0_UNCC3|nr:MAG: hypothetical protein B5M47_01855 [candidate division CPR3 bacterium 4484_211]
MKLRLIRKSKIKRSSKSQRTRILFSGQPDFLLAALVLGLTLFGIVMIYDASAVMAFEDFGDRYYFLKRQGFWGAGGLILGLLVSLVDYHVWRRWAKPLLFVSLFFLILVLLPGFGGEIYGAKRRLSLPLGVPFMEQIAFQPSELAKLAVVNYLAAWLSAKKKSCRVVLPFLGVVGVAAGLIMLEPDLGTTITLVGGALVTLFLAPVPLWEVAAAGLVILAGGVGFAFSSEYRRNRLLVFLNPNIDRLGISYHINQILIALGSGGLFGLGLGYSRQKYQYLPEVVTDSIFAVIGEELGFVGALLVVGALFLLVGRGFLCSARGQDLFGRLLAGGITALVGFQIVLNLGSMAALTPLTGLPLPFFSYGRSSLLINLVEMGILLNISKQV